jgi:hypothetical protein
MKKSRILLFAAVGLVLVAADSLPEIDSLVRQGIDAYEAGDLAAALRHWVKAEERTTDPGQVAFNKAAAFYRLGLDAKGVSEQARLLRDAENHYRRCSKEPVEPRRSLALFGLANSLLKTRSDEAVALREAIRAYRDCLASGSLDAQQRADAEHNLKLAKQLWLKVRATAPPMDQEDPDDPPPGNSNDQHKPKDPGATQGGNDPGMGPKKVGVDHQQVKAPDGQNPTETNQQTPGVNSGLPPIRDDEKLTPLTAREAEAHLDQAMGRILQENRNHRYRTSRAPAPGVKDW